MTDPANLPHQLPGAKTAPRSSLRALIVSVTVLIVLACGLFLAYLRGEALRSAEDKAASVARLLEEHVSRTFRTADFIADQVAILGRSMPMEQLAKSEAAWMRLTELKRGMPEPGTLWIVDAEGRAQLGTLTFPVRQVSVADRYYFAAHQEQRRDLVIGPLVNTKQRDAQAFHLSRRIEASDGTLAGVAVVGFDAITFTDFYRNLGLSPHSGLTVSRRDGAVVLRQPDPEQWAEAKLPATDPLMQAVASGRSRGVLRITSSMDGIERMVAFRVLPEFGVVVSAGMALEDAMANWWDTALLTVTAVVMLMGLLGWLAAMAFDSLKREEELIQGLEETVRDRTREAEQRAEEARRANDSKTRFLAAASHDLRQPLQAAGMFVEALSARLEGSPHQNIVDKMRQSIDATQALLSTLLDVSTLEAGHIEPAPTSFALAPMLTTLVEQLEPEATKRGLELRLVTTSATVISDPVLLERMLRNLLFNALRYTRQGKILLGCRHRGKRLAICVIDTGIGIPEDKFTTIFEDFSRLGTKGSGSDRGLGLGLAVVRRMAELLDHQVEVRSQVDKGSTFAVIVPTV